MNGQDWSTTSPLAHAENRVSIGRAPRQCPASFSLKMVSSF